jgi:cyclase
MEKHVGHSAWSFSLNFLFYTLLSIQSFSQDDVSQITVRATVAGGVVYMLDCENGFGGGNVAASIGPDGILLVDDMYEAVTGKLVEALKKIADSDIRIVINSHFHRDHIEGNSVLSRSSMIIAHENLLKRLMGNPEPGWPTPQALPHITFNEKLNLQFNGEEVQVFHLPNGHTDNDVFVYFTKSKVIHMGDTFFNGMFPAVYKEGGGNILQLITNLEKILKDMPPDIKIIPGHGALATKTDLVNAVAMLRETTTIVGAAIKSGKSLKQLQEQNVLSKYTTLGDGGAQTTDQYLTMLYKLLAE